ncbi:DUF1259 domain-containing protein [Planococcus shenhongbingii]|uniref:DUF1259 domain-containing protein n=1 Tax=Planococcus shenhongbingii TaxID=3058398 RepID=UPI002616D711|nr:DUF1259 domain-containing protein [Planococcus sp. N016]WKA56942.1 DUF1259 domain-containing protein [Planococcus sp. N016]
MVEVVDTDSQVFIIEKVSKLLDIEVETDSEICQFKKKRTAEAQRNSKVYVRWALDLKVSISSLENDGQAVNEAEIFLLPEELPNFTSALIQHSILFPTNFSQQLSMERGMYCIRIKSQESPINFAERLVGALKSLA